MRKRLIERALAVAVCVAVAAVPSAAVVPPGGTATLSFIGQDHVEIVYGGQDLRLRAASPVQTARAISIVLGTPPGPVNPILVEQALRSAGIPFLKMRSCRPGDGSLVILPTAPQGLADRFLAEASQYYDPNLQAREFAASYWRKFFREVGRVPAPPGWPGNPSMESIKEQIVNALPYPANLGTMLQYQARGFVPFMHVYGQYVKKCSPFGCVRLPKCLVRFNATAEGYGLRGVR